MFTRYAMYLFLFCLQRAEKAAEAVRLQRIHAELEWLDDSAGRYDISLTVECRRLPAVTAIASPISGAAGDDAATTAAATAAAAVAMGAGGKPRSCNAVVALYRQNTAGDFEFVAQSEVRSSATIAV
jgi:hypothetical protein